MNITQTNRTNDLLDIRVTYEVIECHDPYHCHNTPMQILLSGWRDSHYVELTIDGDRCNTRVDDGIALVDVSFAVAAEYIKRICHD